MNIRYNNMMKYLLFLFVFAHCYFILFAQKPININFNIPENVNAGTEFNANIIINKQNVNGFAKLELYLPVGFISKVTESAGATTIRKGQLLKFIWIELPDNQIITLSVSFTIDYRLAGYKEIYGNFYYIYQKEKIKFPVGVIPFNVINTSNNKDDNNKYNTAIDKKIIPTGNIQNTTYYRVQIAANKKRITKKILEEIYTDNSSIYEEFINGLYKYTIGNFVTKQDAESFRINCGISGAFTVTYENGSRIIYK